MRIITTALLCLTLGSAIGQEKDSMGAAVALRMAGLSFTAKEIDSMQDKLKQNKRSYERLHRLSTPNSLAFPFAYKPAPAGVHPGVKQENINWQIPSGVSVPKDKNELAFYSIPQLASLIRNKKMSSVELTGFFLGRLKKWGDTLECVISLTDSLAMAQARQADAEIAAGKYRGILHGIPYGLKDLFAVKGYKTTWGAVPYKDQYIDEDAYVYTRLREAGAVLCAKLTLGELAYNDLWFGGRTRNPWNIQTGSSGSSAGSASATAAGLLPFTIGTETHGSIISPSHTCGTTGFRPSFGAVSRSGAMVLCWSLDKIGPICRSVEDAAIVFQYIKGTDGKDASAIEMAFNYKPLSRLSGIRVGVPSNYFKNLPGDAPQRKIDKLKELGAELKYIEIVDSALYPVNLIDIVLNAESAAAFDELTRSDRDDLIRRQDKNFWPHGFRAARTIPAVEYINTTRHRSTLVNAMDSLMKGLDIIVTPSFAGSQMAVTNLTGQPVVAIPVGFMNNGLPTSISFVGKIYDDARVLQVAAAVQAVTDAHKKHPEKFRH